MSAQGEKPLLEVECCDSGLDKNLTSPRSVARFDYRGGLDFMSVSMDSRPYGGLPRGVGRLASFVYLQRLYSQNTFIDHTRR